MVKMNLSAMSRKIISEVVSLPTAPFHEHAVIGYVIRFCIKHGFRMKQDRVGNIFIRYKNGKARQPITFSAHMDHPGLEILSVKGREAYAGIIGSINYNYFKKANVVISTMNGLVKGKVVGRKKRKWMGEPVFKIRVDGKVSKADFGYYDLLGVQFKGDKIFTKSADDLAGVALLLELLLKLKKSRVSFDVTVLLTRAEEAAFIGCMSAIESKIISKKTPIIVLEASNSIKGNVDIGGGPVLRVGDKQSTFSASVDLLLQDAATIASRRKRNFRFQRALLSGGRCEGSAYILKDFIVGGVAFPLGNYHNNGPNGYACEYIGVDDYINTLELFYYLSISSELKTVVKKRCDGLWKNYRKWKERLL